uniref:Lipocalin/cytosolic fatty-acid binding domain-containing protein n=1 Tax=Nomascus leucogenys TaxID=61853 RepID=A0A2I3GPZ0_NOMLE
MQCLLLTLGAALVCGVRAIDIPQTMQDVELPKLAGTWHSMAMATNNVSLMATLKAPLRVHITSLWPTPEDNLEIVLHRWWNNSCVEKKILGEKTENPKKFKINCERPQDHHPPHPEVLVEDDEIMQGFIRAFRPLPRHLWYLLDLKEMEEPCRF